LAEDLALGLAVGYCVELMVYVVARAAGVPGAVLTWPIATYVMFALVPGLRIYWRGSGRRVPIAWSWSLVAMLGFLLLLSVQTFLPHHQLAGADSPYVDMPFHLALIGELKHHLPPAIPYVADTELGYHWFYYAEAAATSWAAGIEPATLLYRLSILPMVVVFVLLTAVSARHLTGRWWSGPIAVALALFGATANPYSWISAPGPVFDTRFLATLWLSPTSTLALALLAAVLLVVADLLGRRETPTRSQWLLVGILILGVAGAKAPILPLVGAGLLSVVVIVALIQRRIAWRALIGLSVTACVFGLSVLVVYRLSTGGLDLGFDSLRSMPLVIAVGGRFVVTGLASYSVPLVVLAVAAALWSFLWAGAFGVIPWRKPGRVRPQFLFLGGICLAALGATALFEYPSFNQIYFLRTAAGAFGLVSTAGLVALARRTERSRMLALAVAVAILLGAIAVLALHYLGPATGPHLGPGRGPEVIAGMLLPVGALVLATGIFGWAAHKILRAVPSLRHAAGLLTAIFVMGFSAPAIIESATSAQSPRGEVISTDAIDAARWLRDHSDPDQLVATNIHCVMDYPDRTTCDARHFWVSGYSERRILVEGWAYTREALEYALTHRVDYRTIPFWDPMLLEQNDRAFSNPSVQSLASLRDEFGVRWLFADLAENPGASIGEFADLRFGAGQYAVYELR
jgi:hypothetical protein